MVSYSDLFWSRLSWSHSLIFLGLVSHDLASHDLFSHGLVSHLIPLLSLLALQLFSCRSGPVHQSLWYSCTAGGNGRNLLTRVLRKRYAWRKVVVVIVFCLYFYLINVNHEKKRLIFELMMAWMMCSATLLSIYPIHGGPVEWPRQGPSLPLFPATYSEWNLISISKIGSYNLTNKQV